MDKTLISILGGLGGMFGWGASDFLANAASEKVGHQRTLFWSQVAGLSLIGLAMLFSQEKITRVQGLGIAMSVVGIVVTAL